MTSPIETNNVVERERVKMTNEDLIRHARILRNDLAGELPNGVGNTIDALCDRAQSLSDRIDELDAECERAWGSYRIAVDQAMANGQALADLRASLTQGGNT